MRSRNILSCYHFRAVKIEVGEIIPPTCTQDYSMPQELWSVPMVWFIIGSKGSYDPYGADPMYVHRIDLPESDIVCDIYIDNWGYTLAPAIVLEVWSQKNYCVVDNK